MFNLLLINFMEGRFINPYTDYGFKKLFGTEENKELLISFLNAIIFDKEEGITSLTYKNIEQLGDIRKRRNCYFDVYCEVNDGSNFIVEMQNARQDYFKDRSLFYAAKPIRDQAQVGEDWDFRLENVYMVGVMNFRFPDNEYPEDSYYHVVKLMDIVDQHVFYDKLTLIYLEMPKLKNMTLNSDSMREKWLYALHSLCYTDSYPEELHEAIFKKLFTAASIANLNEAQWNAYDRSRMDMWDYYSTLKTAKREGLKEGRAEGREEGRAEGLAEGRKEGLKAALAESKNKMLDVARNLKELGMDDETIMSVTGLTSESVEKL